MECATTRERRKALPRFDERLAKAARRREPAVGQEAVSSRSRMRRPVRSQWLTQRHGSALASLGLLASLRVASPLARRLWLNTACCRSAKGVAKTKQRLDRAVGPAVAPCAQMQPQPQRFFNELKSHPLPTSVTSAHNDHKWPGSGPLTSSPNGARSPYLSLQVVYMMPVQPGVRLQVSSQARQPSRSSAS